ncbi:MAG TPA: ATP-binding cassette domain-containing protein, partial [Burkholderiales bacterium]|nr:ATP-binding cassette domain-containing protein [Burkholderiales bacterium]
MLEVRGVSLRFGGVQALSGVSVAAGSGDITALIGPNGAGKTTLFGVVSGFLAPDEGSVHFLGEDVTGRAPHLLCRLGVARTFQIVRPFALQTVRENIAVGAHLARASRREALAHAERVAAQVGLASQLDKPA